MRPSLRAASLRPAAREGSAWIWRILHRQRTAWVILVVSIGLTGLAWYISDRSQKDRSNDRFMFRTKEVDSAIAQRMQQYETVLRGGVALFDASSSVTREEWRSYVRALDFQDQSPGIQGMGFSVRVPRAERDAHIQAVRAEGFPTYTITPDGERDEYHSIVYLEPFDERNRRAFGYDMHSEPTRRAAMDRARDSASSSVSGVVTLKQEIDQNVQNGFLMYIPVFRRGVGRESPEARRHALQGFVFAAFRGRDLMGGIFGRRFSDLDYWIFDGPTPDRRALLFQNHPSAQLGAASDLSGSSRVQVAGRDWNVQYASSSRRFDPTRAQPLIIAFGGLLIDVLLFAIVGSLARTQERASLIANDMTGELRRSLKEKEVLLQEVHHRVKNNLQMISSLINLQLRKLESGPARDALQASQGRVLAIALIHERLYQVDDFSGVPFASYVRDLASSIVAATDVAERIQLRLELEDVVLDVGQAIPCGLILQELMSNAFKHAFAPDAAGMVRVQLSERDGVVTLGVRDDGVGFSSGSVPAGEDSLGLRLIGMLAEQLEAEIEHTSDHGARCAIRFSKASGPSASAS